MKSFFVRLAIAGALAALPMSAASAPVVTADPDAPAELSADIGKLARGFSGIVGIAVRSVDEGWTTGWRTTELFPQQSVSKFWVALTAFDAIDRGKLDLDSTLTLTRDDLTLFHQPLRAQILNGGHTTTLGALIFQAITKSDNTANDKVMRTAGGPAAVREFIARHDLKNVRFYDGERALQSRIAGLTWKPAYSIGNAFYKARDAVPYAKRKAAFDRYVIDPFDGAAPASLVDALARLKRGELLSAESTARMLRILGSTTSGPNRLKGGVRSGWSIGHKTGTGQVLRGFQAGYNDIGILTAPDGSSYAVAVMIKKTSSPLGVRMKLMNNVVEAVIASHEKRNRGRHTL